MRVTGNGRTIVAAALGMALVLSASGARAQAAADPCELTVVLGAPQAARPWGSVDVLVTSARSDAPHECARVARAVALSVMQSGENVYIRGFGSFITRTIAPRARPKEPKLTRAE